MKSSEYHMGNGVEAFSAGRGDSLPFPVVQAHQVNSDRVEVVYSADTTRDELEGVDAMVTDISGVTLGARTADFVPGIDTYVSQDFRSARRDVTSCGRNINVIKLL